MTLSRARILRNPSDVTIVPKEAAQPAAPSARRLLGLEVEARERAELVVAAATRRAAAILAAAERDAEELRRSAVEHGHRAGFTEAAALALRLRERQARAEDAASDRIVELARLLAERLLGHALRTDPAEVAALAAQTLAEAGGALRVELRANPLDAEVLRGATSSFDPGGRVHAVVSDESLARGDIRLNTELGMIDARLGSELIRLAERLREALAT